MEQRDNSQQSLIFSRLSTAFVIFLVPAFLFGCAAQQGEVKRRFFWPPLPDQPKVEFIASYRTNLDLPKSAGQALLERISGATDVRGFEKPWGIAARGKDRIYIVDTINGQVIRFDLVNNNVDSLGKGEYEGLFEAPIGIALDNKGSIYVSDPKKNKVQVFTADEKPLMTIGGDEALDWPTGMAVNDRLGRLYVANAHSHDISVFDLEGKFLFKIGKRGIGDVEFNFPIDIDTDSKGNIVVADSMNARIQVLEPDGKFIRKFGQRGDGNTDFQVMKGIAVDKATDNVYVVDGRANKFLIFDKEGNPLLTVGGPRSSAGKKLYPGGFLLPQDIFIDDSGAIFITDGLNKAFHIYQIVNMDWLKKNPIK